MFFKLDAYSGSNKISGKEKICNLLPAYMYVSEMFMWYFPFIHMFIDLLRTHLVYIGFGEHVIKGNFASKGWQL